MTKRPLLIFNGKPTLYRTLDVRLCAVGLWNDFLMPEVFIRFGVEHPYQHQHLSNAQVSQSTRPSGRRVIWVHAEVEDGVD